MNLAVDFDDFAEIIRRLEEVPEPPKVPHGASLVLFRLNLVNFIFQLVEGSQTKIPCALLHAALELLQRRDKW